MPDSSSGFSCSGNFAKNAGATSGIMPNPSAMATMKRLLRLPAKSTRPRMRTPVAATMPNMTMPPPPSTNWGTASTSAPSLGMSPSASMITPPATQT